MARPGGELLKGRSSEATGEERQEGWREVPGSGKMKSVWAWSCEACALSPLVQLKLLGWRDCRLTRNLPETALC